jgi:hypothetical protein
MLIILCSEIKGKHAWIGWTGTEALTSYRTGILAGLYTFARLVCHYRPEAAFFGWHTKAYIEPSSDLETKFFVTSFVTTGPECAHSCRHQIWETA